MIPPIPPPSHPPAATPATTQSDLAQRLGPDAVFECAGTLPAVRVPPGEIHEGCRRLKEAGFDYLLFVTAVDYPQEQRLELVYALSNFVDGRELGLVSWIDRAAPRVDSVCDLWDTAEWHEREVFDLIGVHFDQHPDLRRILLDDSWEGHPLRKDYMDRVHDVVKRPY